MKLTLKTPDHIPKPKGSGNFLHPWPSDLPKHCPECHTTFDPRLNLNYKKSKLAQAIREIAWWSPLPSLPIAIFICFGMNLSGNGAMMSLAMMIILPAILLNLIYAILPTHRYVTCKHCTYQTSDKKPRYTQP